MKASWARLHTRYMALARRERGLVLAASLVLVIGLGVLLFVEPALKQRALLHKQRAQQQAELTALRPQVLALQARQRQPDAATWARLNALRQQLQLADGEFAQLQRALVAPHEMGALMENLLRAHRGLQLVGLHSVPVTSVNELMAPAAPASAPAADARPAREWLYRHGVQITVQGSYADMAAYLAALERLPRRVYWGELKIDAQRWPATVMTVTVYTISLEKTWWRV
jgi:MSHA biogenesis protein MshJ